MNRTMTSIKEWINPNWARHRTVPPFEAGLRPNSLLDETHSLLADGAYEPEDVVVAVSGVVLFSSRNAVYELGDGAVETLAELGGPVGSLVERDDHVVAAVDGVGLVSVSASGATQEICVDESVRSCVTDMAALPDGSLLVAVGSSTEGIDGWARTLLRGEKSGRLVRVLGSQASVEVEGLAWPSGVAVAGDDDVLVSLSLGHRIERRPLASLARPGKAVVSNLPVYPGRLRAGDDGWWVAAPFVRNRITELLLDEPEVLSDMVASIRPDEWFVPRLRSTNPYTDTAQLGQVRVLGLIKPWAPPRSYGLVFRLDDKGRIAESVHSRVNGERHGVTGVGVRGGRVVAAAKGYRNLLELDRAKG